MAQPVWNLLTLSSDRFQGPWVRKAKNEPSLHFISFVQDFVYELGKPKAVSMYAILAHWPSCISVTNSKRTIQALKRNSTVCYMVATRWSTRTRRPLLWALVLCLGSRGSVRIHLQIGGRAGSLTNSRAELLYYRIVYYMQWRIVKNCEM